MFLELENIVLAGVQFIGFEQLFILDAHDALLGFLPPHFWMSHK